MTAALKVFRNGAWQELTSLKVYRNGAWRRLKTLKVYSGGAWRQIGTFVSALSLSTSGSTTTVIVNGFPQTTNFASATPSGGLSPYFYSWTVLSGSGTIYNPTSATTQVSGSGTVTFRCTCTDSAGQTATSDLLANF